MTEQNQIDALKPLVTAGGPMSLEQSKTTLDQRMVVQSLIDAGFVSGISRRDELGRPADFINLSITPAGVAHLRELERQKFDGTSLGFLHKHRTAIYAYFFGILSTIFAAWLLKQLGISK